MTLNPFLCYEWCSEGGRGSFAAASGGACATGNLAGDADTQAGDIPKECVVLNARSGDGPGESRPQYLAPAYFDV